MESILIVFLFALLAGAMGCLVYLIFGDGLWKCILAGAAISAIMTLMIVNVLHHS